VKQSPTTTEALVPDPTLSIVIPVYNEAPNVRAQAKAIVSAIGDYFKGMEILFVDDGSTDETASIIAEMSGEDRRVRLIALGENRGQITAMANGIAGARGEVIVTMDGDLQHDPADVPALVAGVRSGADVVCGYRYNRKDPLFGKRLPSMIFNAMLRLLFHVPVHDSSCTLRAYRPEVIRSLRLYEGALSFVPVLAAAAGFKVREMAVNHFPRHDGQAKYDSPGRFFSTFAEMIRIRLGFRNRQIVSGK